MLGAFFETCKLYQNLIYSLCSDMKLNVDFEGGRHDLQFLSLIYFISSEDFQDAYSVILLFLTTLFVITRSFEYYMTITKIKLFYCMKLK